MRVTQYLVSEMSRSCQMSLMVDRKPSSSSLNYDVEEELYRMEIEIHPRNHKTGHHYGYVTRLALDVRIPQWWVKHHFIEHQTNLNIIFRSSNKLEPVHLLMIKREHLNFGFEQTDIEHWTFKPFPRFTKSFIEQARTSFFQHRMDTNVFILW